MDPLTWAQGRVGRRPASLFVARRHAWGVSLRCRHNPEFWLDVGLETLTARGHASDPTQGQPVPGGEFVVRASRHGLRAQHTSLDWFVLEFGVRPGCVVDV